MGVVPRICYCVQALSNPSASALVMWARNAAGSNSPSATNWGIEIANRTIPYSSPHALRR